MNPLDWFRKKPPQKKRSLHEKVDHIDEVVVALEDTVGKLYSDMWSKLANLEEQAASRPGIVLAMPTDHSIGASTEFEPLEPLEPIEEVSNDEEAE